MSDAYAGLAGSFINKPDGTREPVHGEAFDAMQAQRDSQPAAVPGKINPSLTDKPVVAETADTEGKK